MKKIPIIAKELKDYPHVPVSALIPMQGSLKDLKKREYEKLKKLMLELGIFMPFAVWMETGKLLDGHQRLRVFEGEGWDFDVPVLYVSAANELVAKQKLLAISSQFGQVTQEGFDEFTYDLSDDWIQESVHFDALPLVFEDFLDTSGEGEQGEEQPKSDGSLLDLLDVTINDPRHKVESGQVWKMGQSWLFCVDIFMGWPLWVTKLQNVENALFVPMPGPLVALSKKAEKFSLIMVQPSKYIAGHILDRYCDVHGEEAVKLYE